MNESVEVRLARIEEKQDQILEKLDEGKKVHEELEARIAKLERWQAYVLGGAAVIGVAAGKVWELLTK